MNSELMRLRYFQRVAESVISKTGVLPKNSPVPWLPGASPTALRIHYGKNANIYILPIDTSKVNASALMKQSITHDVSAALGGFPVSWKNSKGLALVFGNIPVEKIDLLEACVKADRQMIVGKPGSGKTSLMQHITKAKAVDHSIIILDPKVPPANEVKWPYGDVVGQRGCYDDIVAQLSNIVGVMKSGGYGHDKLVVIDEYWMIYQERRDVAKLTFQLLTLGREPGIKVIIGTHSERVRGLGIEGEGDLKSAFDIVVRLSKVDNNYSAAIDDGDRIRPAIHPGPFACEVNKSSSTLLTEAEIELVKLSVYELAGSFSVAKLAAISTQTEWYIRSRAEKWEELGLLTPGGSGFPKTGRMVTDRLKKMAGLM